MNPQFSSSFESEISLFFRERCLPIFMRFFEQIKKYSIVTICMKNN